MPANVGPADRLIRLVLGAVLIVLPLAGAFANPILHWGAMVVGAILILTALVRFCPLYRLLGLSTCRTSRR